MAFPVPKDVRADRDFEIIKGLDDLIRTPALIADPTQPIVSGEWMKYDAQGRAAKLTAADTVAQPALGARLSWTLYAPGDSNLGQSDVLATKQADLLSGLFQAKSRYFDPAAAYQPGWLLVPVFDATNNRGVLSAVDPGAATVRQLAAAVAEVVQPPTGGRLWFETRK